MKKALMGVAVCVALAVVVTGCSTGAKGPTDQELVTQQVNNLKAAIFAKDIEKIMATLSENFYQPELGDKAAARDLAQQGIDGGYTEGAEIDVTAMQVTVTGDTATASPIDVSASLGSITAGVELKKEKGGWLIVGGQEGGY